MARIRNRRSPHPFHSRCEPRHHRKEPGRHSPRTPRWYNPHGPRRPGHLRRGNSQFPRNQCLFPFRFSPRHYRTFLNFSLNFPRTPPADKKPTCILRTVSLSLPPQDPTIHTTGELSMPYPPGNPSPSERNEKLYGPEGGLVIQVHSFRCCRNPPATGKPVKGRRGPRHCIRGRG